MSFIKYLALGSSAINADFYRSSYDKDEIVSTGSTFAFEGKVLDTPVTDEKRAEAIVDSAVKVNTVSEALRTPAAEVWNEARDKSNKTFIVTLITGIAGVGVIALGAAFPPLLPVALAVGCVALLTLGISALAYYRKTEAEEHLEQWANPIHKVSSQRVKCSTEGFFFARETDLKGTSVSEQELQSLWHKEMEKNHQEFENVIDGLDPIKTKLVRSFMEKCPLEKENFEYTFGERESCKSEKNLAEMSVQFDAIKKQYDQIREHTESQITTIKNKQAESRLRNDHMRQLKLAPYERMRNRALQAQARRGESSHRAMEIEMMYRAMTAPIEALHQQNQSLINSWAAKELQKISTEEDRLLVHFFQPIREKLQTYKSQDFSKKPSIDPQTIRFPEPSAPPLEENYIPPQYNPAWAEYVPPAQWEQRYA